MNRLMECGLQKGELGFGFDQIFFYMKIVDDKALAKGRVLSHVKA
jgi:hypothetical protein